MQYTDSLAQPMVPIEPSLHHKVLTLSTLDQTLNPQVQYQLYLNHIALEMGFDWLSDDLMPYLTIPYQNWKQVDGSALRFRSRKTVVIIPGDTIDAKTMSIPDYWLSGTNQGDYFLWIQIDCNELWLKFFGFIDRKTVEQSPYNSEKESYTVQSNNLVADIAVLSIINQICC